MFGARCGGFAFAGGGTWRDNAAGLEGFRNGDRDIEDSWVERERCPLVIGEMKTIEALRCMTLCFLTIHSRPTAKSQLVPEA
jgi:hypothetical protein